MDSISILIKAILEKSSEKQLEQELKQIENKLKPVNVKITSDSESQIKLYNSLQKIYKEEEKQRLLQEKASDKSLSDKEKILQYEQKVRKAIEDSISKEKQKTKELQEQISLFQKRMQLESSRITGKYDTLVDSKSLSNLQEEINGLSNATPNVSNRMKDLSLGMKEVELNAKNSSKAIKNTKQDSISFFEDLRRSAFKFTEWYLLAGGVTSFIDSLKQGIITIVDMDTSITNLKKVSDELGNSVGIKDFLSDVNGLAIEVGHSTKAAIDSVTSFKKLGYSLLDSQSLAKEALIYSNISDQSIEDATQSIISTLKGFQLGVEDVNHVMDSYNEVGNKFSITSAGIGSALQRSSSTLYEAGNTLEQSIGLITAANASIQNPEKVGNGLKTVAMRIRGIADESGEAYPELDKLIKTITGVDIMKDKNTFKSTYDIIVEISNVWKSLTDTNRATLQEAMFGKQQGSVGASLLNNMSDGIKATETAMNSLGSSTKEQARYMESIQAHINTLKETSVNFWNQSIDSNTIKGFVDGITTLVNSLGNLNNVLLLAGTALAVWKGSKLTSAIVGLKDFSLATKMASSEMKLFKTIGAAMQLQEMGLLTANQLLGASFKALGVSIKTAFLSNPIGWLALIGTTIYEVYNAISSGAEKSKQKIAEFNEEVKQQKEVLKSIDSLAEQYQKNALASSSDENAKSQLLDIQNQLKEAFEKTGKSIEFETGNIEKNIKAIQNLKKEQIKDYINTNFATINQIKSDMSKKSNSFDVFNSSLGGTNLSFGKVSDNVKNTLNKDITNFSGTKEEYVKLLSEIIDKQRELNLLNSPEYLGDKFVSNLSDKYKELKKEVEDNTSIINTFNEYQKSFVKESIVGIEKLDEKQKDLYSNLSNSIKFDPNNSEKYQTSLQGLTDIIIKFGNEPDKLKVKLQEWTNANNVTSASVNELGETVEGSANIQIKSFDELTKEVKAVVESVKELNDIQADLSKGNKLTADSVVDLVTKYPELLGYIQKTADGYTIEASSMDIVREALVNKQMVALETESGITNIMKEQLQARLDVYGIELESIKTLNDARNASLSLFGNIPEYVKNDKGFSQYKQGIDKELESIAKLNSLKDLLTSGLKTNVKKPKVKGAGSNRGELDQSEALIEKDRYYLLNQELSKTNNLLEKNAALQENASYEKKVKLLDEEIKLLKQKQINISNIAKENRKERDELVKSLKQDGVKFTGTGDNISATNASKVLDNSLNQVNLHRNDKNKTVYNNLKKQYDELKDSLSRFFELQITEIPKAGKEWLELSGNISKVNLDKISLSFEVFNDSLEPANRQLKELEHEYNMLGENDVAQKEKNINSQMVVKSKILNDINGKILEYRKQLLSATGIEKEKIQENIDDLTQRAYELQESLREITKKANDDKLDLYNDTIDKIKDLLKKQYDLEEKALDKSLDKYKEYIDDRIKENDRLYDSQDYSESVNESNTKIAEIQAKIDVRKMAAMQGDMVAINEIAELQKEKEEEEKNLKDKQKDWERKKTQENLKDQLDYYEDYTDDQKKLLAEKTTDTALQLQAEKILAQQNINDVQNSINNLFTITGENATKAGQLLQQELISRLQQIMDIQANLGYITASSSKGINNTQSNTSISSNLSYKDRTKEQMRINSDAYGTASASEKQRLSDDSLRLGTSIGWTRDSKGYWHDETGKLAQYANGGIDSTGGMKMLDGTPSSVETIFNATQGKKLFDFVNNLPNLPNSMMNIVPNINLPKLAPLSNIGTGMGNITIGDINIHGVSKVDNSTLPKLQNNIINQIKIQMNKGGVF